MHQHYQNDNISLQSNFFHSVNALDFFGNNATKKWE